MGDKSKVVTETALATIAPEALLPALVAKKATMATVDVITGDLAVVRVQYPRGTKKNPLPPVEVEYHVNLVGIGLGAFLAALAALVGVVAWKGSLWTPGLQPLTRKQKAEAAGLTAGIDIAIATVKKILGLG